LAKAYKDGFVHSGEYVLFRKKKYGASTAGIPGDRFVVFNQNHDQIGNRADGARLSALVDYRALKIASAAVMLSPYIPMLFMGEEYGEDNPFHYFISHTEAELIDAVKEGRRNEFASWHWTSDPPDPQDEDTFVASKLSWNKRKIGRYKSLLEWNTMLINLRNTHPALQSFCKDDIDIYIISNDCFGLSRRSADGNARLLALFNLSAAPVTWAVTNALTGLLLINDSNSDSVGNSRLSVDNVVTIPELTVRVYSDEISSRLFDLP